MRCVRRSVIWVGISRQTSDDRGQTLQAQRLIYKTQQSSCDAIIAAGRDTVGSNKNQIFQKSKLVYEIGPVRQDKSLPFFYFAEQPERILSTEAPVMGLVFGNRRDRFLTMVHHSFYVCPLPALSHAVDTL